ncbi:glycosyltransferase [Clavibacter phaseoli]|uniref:glycosyltransferase n=1 Tax=Clavibacter phaseoli TaxID=1734031 RepID=UPI0011C24088|nr:glycosyltransferase [Clavibacter phaseoli]
MNHHYEGEGEGEGEGSVSAGDVNPPRYVDRIVIHQFDPARPSPGGIDTCLRGIARYADPAVELAFVGVDTGLGPVGRALGRWEQHRFGERSIWFLPVVRLDPADQVRRIPHSIRLMAGVWRFRNRLPARALVQVHRMDTAFAASTIVPGEQSYFIHTQEAGLTGKTSDSFWRWAGAVHRGLERRVATRASQVIVFNPSYIDTVRRWNPVAVSSPTWFDPRLISPTSTQRNRHQILWVGRLETPKDPLLAIDAFASLVASYPSDPWSLEVLGSGTLLEEVRGKVATLHEGLRQRIRVHGRVAPEDVGRMMSSAGVFLMTSHAGYEGYPRVLVEALAAGLVPVVTEGSDTGALVVGGATGFVTDRQASVIAARMRDALDLPETAMRRAVEHLSAPSVVSRIFVGAE